MHPFTAVELGASFSLDKALQTGLIPVVERSADPAKTLSAYVDIYLREEIQAEGMVRNLARECQAGRGIVTGYIDILEDLLLAYRLPVFAKRPKRKTASHHKFYLFDNGLYHRLRQRGPLDIESEISGPAIEGLVGQNLRAYLDFTLPNTQLYYWRTLAGNEVDFILYGGKTFTALEVKNTSILRPVDYNGLISFGDDYPEASLILIYKGSVLMKHKNILVVPIEMFLKSPGEYLL